MTVRLFHGPLHIHFVLMTLIVITTPIEKDFLPRLVMLKVQRLEYNDSSFRNLNCSSTRQSFGNGAEFMVNGRTVEHISFHDSKCYNSKRQECTPDTCQCFPNDNVYIYNHENKENIAELGCQMRFADNTTSNIFQVITSVKINGSAMDKYEYDIKILKKNKEEGANIDDKKTNSGYGDISLWLPITCGVLFVVFVVLTVFIYRLRKWIRNRRRRFLQEARKKFKNKYTELMQTEKTEERYFIRTMIVGRESSGKTSLLRRLLKEDISDVASTDGVDIAVGRCKINIEDGNWTIGKEIDDDLMNRIGRAFANPNTDNKHTQNMQVEETKKTKDIHSDRKYITTETNVSPDKSEQTNESASLVTTEDTHSQHMHVDETKKKKKIHSDKNNITTDGYASLDKREETSETSLFVMHEDFTTDEYVSLNKREDTSETSLLVRLEDLMFREFSKSTKHKLSNLYALCEFWDFAGQKEFYATHQAFLTSSAVYLVVADMKDDISKDGFSQHFADYQNIGEYVDFWFDSIHCLRTANEQNVCERLDPPIILVFTGKDKYDKESLRKRKQELGDQLDQVFGMQSKYHHLYDRFYLSNTTDSDEEFKKLRYRIYQAACTMDNWGKAVPLKWIFLEQLIEINRNDGKNFIKFTDMSKLAKHPDINILEMEDLLLFLRFQHNVGNIMFFEDIPDLVILRPQWLAHVFRCLVSDRFDNIRMCHLDDLLLLKRQGKISESLITDIFKSKAGTQFSGQTDNLHRVMEKLDILIKIKSSSYYLMPSMMPSSTFHDICKQNGILTENCKRSSWLCFKFEFLPPSFFNHISAWFIRKYKTSEVEGGIALYRSICMFDIVSSGCTKILVTMSTDTIALQVVWFSGEQQECGSTCSDICREVKQLIDDIKNRYELKISSKLHFKCSDGSYDKNTFEYEKLTNDKRCFCFEHKQFHQSELLYLPWMNNEVTRSPDDRGKISLMQDDLNPKNEPNEEEASTHD